MAGFETIIAWQKARVLTREVYRVTRHGELSRDLGLARQLQRAAVSVMSNIAEGHERRRPNDNLHFLLIAKASCAEVRSLLYVALDVGYIDEHEFSPLLNQSDEVARIIAGLRKSIQESVSPANQNDS